MCFLFFLLLCLAWLWHLSWLHHNPAHPRVGTVRTKIQRLLKPRTPLDGPAYRLSSALSSGMGPSPQPVRPWREVKSQRVAPKQVNTEGFACPKQQCPYFGITDAHIHALLWRRHPWSCRADPDISRPCLSHHVQCATPHPFIPLKNALPSGRTRADGTSLWARSLLRRACLRLPAGHHHEPF
jgi:hypothetical protein